MRELRRLLGQVEFNRLCDLAGGTRVHIPKHYGKPPNGGRDTSRRLKAQFGESLSLLLVFHFGGEVVSIPKRQGSGPIDRRKLKRLSKRRDLSANNIARIVGCDRRTVEKYRAQLTNKEARP